MRDAGAWAALLQGCSHSNEQPGPGKKNSNINERVTILSAFHMLTYRTLILVALF